MSVELNQDYLTWVDIETNALEPGEYGRILELGFKVTDLDLTEVAKFKSVIGYADLETLMAETNDYVCNMHEANGLWTDCFNSVHRRSRVEKYAMTWWTETAIELDIEPGSMPLAGSSLALDRRFLQYWMPDLHGLFHYRSIDNSSTKEMCRRYNPELYAKLPESETDHRVFTCLDGTIEEFKFYVQNFVFDGRE